MANATQTIAGDILLSGDLAGGSDASFPQLTNTGVTPGVYTNSTITVDSKGRVTTAASNPITNLAGDVLGPPGANYLVNTAVTPGAYTNSTITVDSKGRITNAVTSTLQFAGDVSGTFTGGVLTTVLVTTGVTPGIYPNATVTVDAKGRITTISSETTFVTLDGSTSVVAIDGYTGNMFGLELTRNCTLSNPTNLRSGRYTFVIKQGGAGNYTLDYDTNYYFATPDYYPATPVNSTSIVNCISDGTNLYCTIAKTFS